MWSISSALPTYAGAATQKVSASGSRPAFSAALRTCADHPLGDVDVGELEDEPVARLAGGLERERSVGRDPHLELGGARPRELQGRAVVLHRPAVAQLADDVGRLADLLERGRPAVEHPYGGVAATDADDGAVAVHLVEGREHRRRDRPVPCRRVGDHRTDDHPPGLGEDLAVDDVGLLPQQVGVERPHVVEAVLLGLLRERDGAPRGRVGLDDDAEVHASFPCCRGSLGDCHGYARYCVRSRLRNWPWPLVPLYSPSAIRTVPREMVDVDVTVDLEALPRGVVHVHVVLLALAVADGRVPVGVVDDDVGVGARLDHALPAVEPEHPGGRGRDQLDPPRQRDPAVDDTLVEQVHAVLDRPDAVGDGPEVVLAELLLVLHAERAVVGRHHLQVVGAQSLPHRLEVALLLGPQRRRADPLGALEVAPLVALGAELLLQRQVEVLRAGLAEDVLAVVAGPRHLGDGLLRTHVDDVERGVGEVGEHDRAVRRLLLHLPGAGDAVVVRRRLAGLGQLRREYVDRRAVLGVHHRQKAHFTGLLHRPQDLGVVAVEHAGVGHEQLVGRDALVDQPFHRLERVVVDAADDLVEAVVDGAVAGRELVPVREAVLDLLAVRLHGEVDDRRRAAPRGGDGAGLEGVGGRGAAERQLHVGVGVDAAGDDVLPRRVDHLVGLDRCRASRLPGASTATICSPSTSTSAATVPVALTTVPPLIRIVTSLAFPVVEEVARSDSRSSETPQGRAIAV